MKRSSIGLHRSVREGDWNYQVASGTLNDERIRKHARIVLSPHSAFYSVEGYQEMRSKGTDGARSMTVLPK